MELWHISKKKNEIKYELVESLICLALLVLAMMFLSIKSVVGTTEVETKSSTPANYYPPIYIDNAESVAASQAAEEPQTTNLGTFKVTAYCACESCCGESPDGITKSGDVATEGITVGADTDVIPMGTEIYIEGTGTRTVQDTGSGIHGNELDLYFESHQEALGFGVQYLEVEILDNEVN